MKIEYQYGDFRPYKFYTDIGIHKQLKEPRYGFRCECGCAWIAEKKNVQVSTKRGYKVYRMSCPHCRSGVTGRQEIFCARKNGAMSPVIAVANNDKISEGFRKALKNSLKDNSLLLREGGPTICIDGQKLFEMVEEKKNANI